MRCNICGLPSRICDERRSGVCIVECDKDDFNWAIVSVNGSIVDRARTQEHAEIGADVKTMTEAGIFVAKYMPIVIS